MEFYNGFEEQLKSRDIHHLAIGFFDGLHRGHRAVIINEHSRESLQNTCVLSFWPHPMKILNPKHEPIMLTDLEEKRSLLEFWGIGHSCIVPFKLETAQQEAPLFLKLIQSHFPQLKSISVGPNFRFGKHRVGTPMTLSAWCSEHQVQFNLCDFVLENGSPISSSRIRDYIISGNIAAANNLLGHPFTLSGVVIRGKELGRQIGFPTANLQIAKPIDITAGVYATRVKTSSGQSIPGAMNIGTCPTVNGSEKGQLSVEVHLINWSGDLYGQELRCEILDFIRPEKQFGSLANLKLQISQDVVKCSEIAAL